MDTLPRDNSPIIYGNTFTRDNSKTLLFKEDGTIIPVKDAEFSFEFSFYQRETAPSGIWGALPSPFPEVTYLSFGQCISDPIDKHHIDQLGPTSPTSFTLGHAHLCSNDPFRGGICLGRKEWAFNSDGSPSDILIHEYAHVLDDPFRRFGASCKYNHTLDANALLKALPFVDGTDPKSIGHNKNWKKIMIELTGKPELAVDHVVNWPY